jgi:hypothetical protein
MDQLELTTMPMIPPRLLHKLAQLRRRERLLRLAWGASCTAVIFLGLLATACLVDWTYDLWADTPWELRQALFSVQAAALAVSVVILVLWPQMQRLASTRLALMVEAHRPELQHRLISALELNRPGANTQGMSAELLEVVTREAVEQSSTLAFASAADHTRLRHAAVVLVPGILLVAAAAVLFPEVALALVQRQLLGEAEIPRANHVHSISAEIWPSAEEIELHFVADGPAAAEGSDGVVAVQAADNRLFQVPLKWKADRGDGTSLYMAKLPGSAVDFEYAAMLGDGRMRVPSVAKCVPRPSVTEQEAWLVLPEYVGQKPDGSAYEQLLPRGDILGLAGLSVRALAKTQKPVERATLEIVGSPYPDFSGPKSLTKTQMAYAQMLTVLSASAMRPLLHSPGSLNAISTAAAANGPVPLRRFEEKLQPMASTAQWQFDLRATEWGYRVVVVDEYGFANKTAALRSIRIEPEPAPTVVLHAETWEASAPFRSKGKAIPLLDFGGLPLPVSEDGKPGPLRISYEAFGPYGLGTAQLKVGVIRGANESEDSAKKEKFERWVTLPLGEVQPTSRRIFIPSKGTFADSTEKEQIPFYAMPSPNPATKWPRQQGGGRIDYQPSGFLDETGQPMVFKPGDQIVVFVEVFNRNPDHARVLMAKSKTREKDLVPEDRFLQWCMETLQEVNRIESLLQMQQRVYDKPWFSIFGPK